jgi:coiled-coil domain-containing protein 130
MSVRFNAQKSKTGMYYSTPIYKFRMKCHLCDNHFEMQTDPKNLDYVILNGARRQELRWDPKENEQVVPEDKDVSKKLATDSMFKLEHEVEDQAKAKSVAPVIQELEVFQKRWKDDYSFNRAIRQTFRVNDN